MADSVLTLRRMFSLPENGVQDRSPDRWKEFQETISQEVKDIKWTVATPDVVAKIGELFDIEIPDVLVASWKKAKNVQALLDESKNFPEEVMYLELAEHTINSEHHPFLEIRVKNIPAKKVEFTIKLVFKVKGFIIRIQRGLIKEIQTGTCQIQGTLEYKGLTIAEKQLGPIKLPGSIPILESNRRDS